MIEKRIFRIVLILLVVLCNIGCDQFSKKIVRDHISFHQTIEVLGDHLTVTHVENTGAFLSLGDSLPKTARSILLSALPLLVLAFVFSYSLIKTNIPVIMLWGLCFIIGGGIGNLFDRIVYGSVTDFLHIDFGIFRTGIFNMADVSIVTGTVIILFYIFFGKKRHDPSAEMTNKP